MYLEFLKLAIIIFAKVYGRKKSLDMKGFQKKCDFQRRKDYQLREDEFLKILRTREESEIIEYKENNSNPERIGKYVSALGNGAIMTHNPEAYMFWGIEDVTKKIVGTKFNPYLAKASSKNMMPMITYLD